MSQLMEPSLTDYARFYGLTTNYLELDPLAGLPSHEAAHAELDDEPELFRIDDEAEANPLEERLAIDRDTILLLGSNTKDLKHESSFEELGLDPHRIRKLKLELPMLRTDHESDMQDFARKVKPDLANEHLPLELLHEEADEGLGWPPDLHALPDVLLDKCKAEKLDISLGLLDYMRIALNLDSAVVEQPSFELEEVPRKKKKAVEPVTPPLLPLSPPFVPYQPSSDTGRLELLSDSISPTAQELEKVDREVFMNDSLYGQNRAPESESFSLLFGSESLGEIYSPLKGIEDPPSSPPVRKAVLADLKVEVPLTPPRSEKPPPWQRQHVTFKEAIREVLPEMPSPIVDPKDTWSEDIDAFLEDSIAPIAVKAERSIEQEQLQEADTIRRVPVPVMDFSLPLAPWKAPATNVGPERRKENIKETLSKLKISHFSKHHWPGVGETERSLQWMPFPAALGRIETYERIGDDSVTREYIAVPECVDSSTLTWKPEGLRLFDLEYSDEEEFEEGVFPEAKDIGSLIKKRKLELQYEEMEDTENEGDQPPWLVISRLNPVNHEAFRKVPKLSPAMPPKVSEIKQTEVIPREKEEPTDKAFSPLASLEDFMSLRDRGVTKSKFTAEHHFPVQAQQKVQNATVQKDQLPALPAKEQSFPQPKSLAFVAPKFTAPTRPIPLVLSTVFLRDRKLIGHIQRLLPTADFIERDFTLHPAPRHAIHKKSTTQIAGTGIDTIAKEADFILSPSTGLLLTTLQNIKQRSLPGQTTTRSVLHERISRTAPHYERLIIIVRNDHIGSPQATSAVLSSSLDENDCEGLIEFTAFCTSVLEGTQVIIAHGDRENLAQWISSLAVKYCAHNPSIKLLHEETIWEIFLRRAGMNTFAAQVVLGELKGPPEPSKTEGGEYGMGTGDGGIEYGLTAFVKMSERERLERFGVLLGGGRMLRRVGRVLDARW